MGYALPAPIGGVVLTKITLEDEYCGKLPPLCSPAAREKERTTVSEKRLGEIGAGEPAEENLINQMHDIVEDLASQVKLICIEQEAR